MSLVRVAEPPARPALDVLLSRVSALKLREPASDGTELDLIVQAAMRAPDHGQLRPWRFVLIRGPARNDLAMLMETAVRRRDSAVTETMIRRQHEKLTNTPLIIALGAHIQPESNIPEIDQILSVGAAAMNMLNAIHALGFGGVWLTGRNAYDSRVAAALGFEAPDRLVGFLFAGTPCDEPRAVTRSDPRDYTIEWTGRHKEILDS